MAERIRTTEHLREQRALLLCRGMARPSPESPRVAVRNLQHPTQLIMKELYQCLPASGLAEACRGTEGSQTMLISLISYDGFNRDKGCRQRQRVAKLSVC